MRGGDRTWPWLLMVLQGQYPQASGLSDTPNMVVSVPGTPSMACGIRRPGHLCIACWGIHQEATQLLGFPHPICYSQPRTGLSWELPMDTYTHIHAHIEPSLAFAVGTCVQTQGMRVGQCGDQHSARRYVGVEPWASARAACWSPQGSLYNEQGPGHLERLIQLVCVGPGFIMFLKLLR